MEQKLPDTAVSDRLVREVLVLMVFNTRPRSYGDGER